MYILFCTFPLPVCRPEADGVKKVIFLLDSFFLASPFLFRIYIVNVSGGGTYWLGSVTLSEFAIRGTTGMSESEPYLALRVKPAEAGCNSRKMFQKKVFRFGDRSGDLHTR